MALEFPTNPTNGQVVSINGINYVYIAAKQYWLAAKADVNAEISSLITNLNLDKLNFMGF